VIPRGWGAFCERGHSVVGPGRDSRHARGCVPWSMQHVFQRPR
jgi:hypothetical protein